MVKKEKVLKILKNNWFAAAVAFLLGALLILAIRFAIYKPDRVHYHANFAVFINGQQEQFKDDFYYEEVGAACVSTKDITPHDRAHMHEHEAGLIHVHDRAVTWGNFFQNIGWDVNPFFVKTPKQVYLADDSHKVTFMLNGQVVPNAENLVIGDKDQLVVDFGDGSQNLQNETKAVPNNAAQEDAGTDPASCGGSAPVTFHERITHLF